MLGVEGELAAQLVQRALGRERGVEARPARVQRGRERSRLHEPRAIVGVDHHLEIVAVGRPSQRRERAGDERVDVGARRVVPCAERAGEFGGAALGERLAPHRVQLELGDPGGGHRDHQQGAAGDLVLHDRAIAGAARAVPVGRQPGILALVRELGERPSNVVDLAAAEGRAPEPGCAALVLVLAVEGAAHHHGAAGQERAHGGERGGLVERCGLGREHEARRHRQAGAREDGQAARLGGEPVVVRGVEVHGASIGGGTRVR